MKHRSYINGLLSLSLLSGCVAGYTNDIKGTYTISDISFDNDNCRLQDAESTLLGLNFRFETNGNNISEFDTGVVSSISDNADDFFEEARDNLWNICYSKFPNFECNRSILSLSYKEWQNYPQFQNGCIADITASNFEINYVEGLFLNTNRFVVRERLSIQCGSSGSYTWMHCNSYYSMIFDKIAQ